MFSTDKFILVGRAMCQHIESITARCPTRVGTSFVRKYGTNALAFWQHAALVTMTHTQHDGIQHNDVQHSDTLLNDIPQNNK